MDTILIVDDEPQMLGLLEVILGAEGYHIETALDGTEAQSMIGQGGRKYSAILLDWVMPGMSGIELLRWIKEQPRFEFLPVIMHTAMTQPSRIREGIEAGAFYYLTKPTDHSVILSIVKVAVDDFNHMRSLLGKLQNCENPLNLMVEGTFRFRTIEEGEYLAVRIANSCPDPERVLPISELIINAIEHGNLRVSYEEKSRYLAEGVWYSVIEERLKGPEYAQKYVELKIQRHPEKLTVMIEDQGPGFDFQTYIKLDEARVFDNHGRGIALASSYLGVEYIGSGNKVRVTIPFV